MPPRIVEIGGLVAEEEEYFGRWLVVFSIDPGISSGWSCLKVPVDLIGGERGLGVSRTLARSWWQHGTIRRSKPDPHRLTGRVHGPGGGAYDATDSQHVDDLLDMASLMSERYYESETAEARFVFVSEGFDLRMMSMDPSLLAPVRIAALLADRLRDADAPIFFQKVSDAKRVVTDQRLKSMLMYSKSSGAHARDADRHSVLFIRKFASDKSIRQAVFE